MYSFTLSYFFQQLKVPTIFWWDNFDENIDKSGGGGSMHIALGMVCKEPVTDSQCLKEIVSIAISKHCS